VDRVCQHISLLETDYFSLTFRDSTDGKVSSFSLSSGERNHFTASQ